MYENSKLQKKYRVFIKDIVTIRIKGLDIDFFFVTDLPGFQFLAHLATQVIDVFVEVNKFFDNYL